MLQAPTHPTKLVHGGRTYVIPSSHAVSGQPFSITLGARGKIEVSYEQRTAKPVVSVSHVTRREDRSRETTPKHSPRSDVATLGSSTYLHSGSSRAQSSSGHHHSEHREHKPSTPRSAHSTPRSTHHDLSSSPKNPLYVTSNGLLTVPGANVTYERQRRHSSTHYEGGSKPVAIPAQRPVASPEKHAHFSLSPHSTLHEQQRGVSASPRQSSRHSHSHSQDSYFRQAPRGWYNRRGDEFVKKGVVRRQPDHLQWHKVFADYPEPGQGWMNEERQILPYHGGILSHK